MLEYTYSKIPAPHIYFPQLLPPKLYEKAKFPIDIPVRAAGRSGRDLFMGEPGFSELVQSDGFRELFHLFTNSDFVRWILGIFEKDLFQYHCHVDVQKVKLIEYLETREVLKEWPSGLPGDHDVNEVFNRFDFSIGDSSYTEYVHLDSPRRIVGGMLFFSDAGKEGMDGGEFTLYRDLLYNNDRVPHWPLVAKKYPVRENTGVLFLNCNRGFHGPAAIRAIHGSRRWIYYSISSRVPVWEPGRSRMVSRAVVSVLSRLGQEWRIGKPVSPKSKGDADRY